MENRRDFLKKAGLLAGSLGLFNGLPPSIQAALKIDPTPGSTYLDAEHIVMVMQENRSFDHSFGSLRGVRGFNDRRALRQENGNPVWLQSYQNGDTYVPTRLDIKNSNAAWTQDLPHSWENQIGAWNQGKFNNWLESKRSGNKLYRDLPLTLGYYTREDIPFYYAFADAFTICDQHFCSSITGTTTNRHFFWTGTCVPKRGAKPLVRNSDTYFNKEAQWRTFPELLEKHQISWKVYQNEISLQNDLNGSAESWLGNFTDNNLEWFTQYHVRYKKSHISHYARRMKELPFEIQQLKEELGKRNDQKVKQTIQQKEQQLESYTKEYNQYHPTAYEQLDNFSKALHERAFQTNEGDPHYHDVETIQHEGQEITVPKGDVLYQFRQDVKNGTLPTVSWLVAPQYFSDHPSAPMYGAWYVSELLQILTEDPEVWKKTIFILNYDENDGYFDHVPPFVAPKPGDLRTGLCSPDLDYSSEYVTHEQELAYGIDPKYATEGPVGLGYRVPLIIASPWSRGGWVNSEVFDITSTIQFMEHFVQKKYGKDLVENNISSWRRAITGDLTSAFRPFQKKMDDGLPQFLNRNGQIAQINSAKEKPAPNNFKKLSQHAIAQIQQGGPHDLLPKQEKGTKPSNALAYEIYIQEHLDPQKLSLTFHASTDLFKEKSLGAAFNAYAYGHKSDKANWSFSTSAGNSLTYSWPFIDFTHTYDLAIHGPNGYYRHYRGDQKFQALHIQQHYAPATEELVLTFMNRGTEAITLQVTDYYQGGEKNTIKLPKSHTKTVRIDSKSTRRWYDVEVTLYASKQTFSRRYAGRMENGKHSISDPLMGH